MNEKIKNTVYRAMMDITGLELDEIEEISGMNLMENGVLDSLSFVSLINFVEEDLGIKINLKKAKVEELSTIEGIEKFISEQA